VPTSAFIYLFIIDIVHSGEFRGVRAGFAPLPPGDGLTPPLTVMLANAKF